MVLAKVTLKNADNTTSLGVRVGVVVGGSGSRGFHIVLVYKGKRL